jgi:probable rRNA maturation factor
MIQFTAQGLKFSLKNKIQVKKWLNEILLHEKKTVGDIVYIFCSDAFLYELNIQYLRHSTLTDIITFDYTENGRISGDIFISIERVRENASSFSNSFEEELGRVMAHGILHLLGYKDKSKDDKKKMTEMENTFLPYFPNLVND